MITIKDVKTLDGKLRDITIESEETTLVDAKKRYILLPALIDPHVHFRTPGAEYKEDWISAAKAAISGGVTRVFDMPNNNPPCVTEEALDNKIELIESQLAEAEIPLRYNLYFGANKDSLEELGRVKKKVIGLKIYMGSTTGGIVMDDREALSRAFRLAAQDDLIVAVHAEDERIMDENKRKYGASLDPSTHSKVRDREAAIKATKLAISLAEEYNTQLLICHLSTKEELDLVRDAKKNSLLVYAEVTPHHLFLSEDDYDNLKSLALVNPPLRTKGDQEALWKGIQDGTVDFIGSDHAPHTLEEKSKPYGQAPSGFPGIETTLPLLLNAYNEKKITLEKIVALTHINIEQIYGLDRNEDYVLVDPEIVKEVKMSGLKTKCGWSPYAGMHLKGWPIYTILKGKVYHC
jgi:dihydroorotase